MNPSRQTAPRWALVIAAVALSLVVIGYVYGRDAARRDARADDEAVSASQATLAPQEDDPAPAPNPTH